MTKRKNPDAFLGLIPQKEKQSKVLQLPNPHSWEQEVMMKAFVTPGLIELFAACGTKFGKAVDITEEIPTTNGYTKFGDIREGDTVFDQHGKPTKVTYVTPTMYNHDCYQIVFQDGQTVRCDAEHLWFTQTHADRKNQARSKDPDKKYGSVKTTLEILASLEHTCGDKPRPNHSIPLVSGPVEFPQKDLPIDPYVLGVWLGDGDSNSGTLTLNDEQSSDILAGFERADYAWYKLKTPLRYSVEGFTHLLNSANLIKNKHIPEEYLIGSPSQRLDLVRGLLDSDGTCGKKATAALTIPI